MAQFLNLPVSLQNPNGSRLITLVDTSNSYASVVASNYLGALQALGHQFFATDAMYVQYTDGAGWFTLSFSGNVITLVPLVEISQARVINVALGHAALASSGHVLIQASSGSQQFMVQDIRVMYSASGLSGSSGDRLIQITDGTTVYNNAGITAALLGTPVNTLWGGSGNPLPGNVAMNTPTAAGASLYAVYSGGTVDYSAGSVNIQVNVRQVA